MIRSINDYKLLTGADVDTAHPHGDLDRIAISGAVHPSYGAVLRGEAVAFLWECILGRGQFNGLYRGYHVFNLSMSSVDLMDIVQLFNGFFSAYFLYGGQSLPSSRESHRTGGQADTKLWADLYWNSHTKYPEPVPELERPLDASYVTYLTGLLGSWFRIIRCNVSYARGDYAIDGSITKSAGWEGTLPSIDDYRHFCYTVYFFSYGAPYLNEPGGSQYHWEYYVVNLRGSGTLRVFVGEPGIGGTDKKYEHVKSVRFIYEVDFNRFIYDENKRTSSDSGRSVLLGLHDHTPDANGYVSLDPRNDIPTNGMVAEYGSPDMRPPQGTPTSSSRNYQCQHYIQIQYIWALVTLDDAIGIT